ncbi:MAG TPA: hypothetical protein VGS41_06045, partial [Chthonomonadales bacterium]|nr:hypothetical protein [Chthonomonadales bacterium]
MSDVGIQRGDVPGGPPLNLPSLGTAPPPRITIKSDPSRAVPFVPPGNVPIAPQNADPHAFIEDYAPTPEEKRAVPKGDPHGFIEDYKPDEAEAKPRPEVSGTSAAISGGLNALSFGFAPAIAGLAAAAGPEWQSVDIYQNADKPVPNLVAPVVGAAKLLHGYLSGHPDESVRNAYEKGRQEALDSQQGADEQHPHAYLAGQFAGSLLSPGFGAMKAGSLGARAAWGFLGGGISGGLYGAGGATSAGGSLADVAAGAETGAALGAPLGGAVGGVIGPRVINPNSPGQRAAATAEALGAPIPRGLASDNPAVNATTAKARSIPVVGSRISSAVDKTQEAAGEFVGDTATVLGGTDRAVADVLARHGLQDVIDGNRQAIDAAYGGLRGQIDT